MDSLGALDCLLAKGLITPAQYALGSKLAAIFPHDISAVFGVMGSTPSAQGSAFFSESSAAVNESTPTDAPASAGSEGYTRVVATAFNNDAIFTVDESTPTGTHGHVMKEGINYTFTQAEWVKLKFIAFDSSSTVVISATFFK